MYSSHRTNGEPLCTRMRASAGRRASRLPAMSKPRALCSLVGLLALTLAAMAGCGDTSPEGRARSNARGLPEQERPAALHKAASAGDVPLITALLEAGVPVDVRLEPEGDTPLSMAVVGVQPEAVACLLGKGADPNARIARRGGATTMIVRPLVIAQAGAALTGHTAASDRVIALLEAAEGKAGGK